ncbi:MAG: peptidoglycan-binding protein [Acidimicrobiia bacterium]|nr:peptidoglycan-binding protein [Acidimicrobiia bacterium]
MRLYREGDSGEAVRDIQDRLLSLGFAFSPDPPGEFAGGTSQAVRNFQSERGLDLDGIVGPDTWRSLYEAGYKFGDRILYRRSPMMRGDDVEELQRRLNDLGFDADKVDGIFGPRTHQALLDFQSNRGFAEDGVVGPLVVRELLAIRRGATQAGREMVNEREWLRGLPTTLVGARIYLDPAAREGEDANEIWRIAMDLAQFFQKLGASPLLSRSVDVFPAAPIRARRANRLGAHLSLCLASPDQNPPCVYFFQSENARSEAGSLLAECIASRLGLPTGGRASAMLRGTRAPAVVTVASLDQNSAEHIGNGVVDFFARAARDFTN